MEGDYSTRHSNRRASASVAPDSTTTPETLAEERTRQAGHALAHALKTSLNDTSIGLYRVCEHVQKRVPQIVQDKRNLRRLEERVELGTANMLDARKTIGTLHDTDTFANVQQWLDQAIFLTTTPTTTPP